MLADSRGHEIDVHAFIFDGNGKVIDGIMYPAESLTGEGNIAGEFVRCIAPKYMVEFLAPWVHKWPEKYLPAIVELCAKFKNPLPKEYLDFKK